MEAHMNFTNFPVKVTFYAADKKLSEVSRVYEVFMESLPSARVYANSVLQMSEATVAEISLKDGPSEIMEREPHLSRYFPLADIASMPRVPHTPNDRLARHFQMAGAVDQARAERLARLWRNGTRAVTATRLGLKFLGREVVTQSANQY
jgi:hypothetical protein